MTFFGDFDIAQLCLYLFWAFFLGLVIYLQRESAREGYPLELESRGGKPGDLADVGPYGVPSPKTFRLPHGLGEVKAPNPEKDVKEITDRKFNMKAMFGANGGPYVPTGDPMQAGVGPGAWAERGDHPDYTLHGEAKIVPLRSHNEWGVHQRDSDIRGWQVIGCDGVKAGVVRDLWVDRSESMFRYVEITCESGENVLAPMTCCLVSVPDKAVYVDSIRHDHFPGVPSLRTEGQITLLEEDKVMAYYAGGKLYATEARAEPLL